MRTVIDAPDQTGDLLGGLLQTLPEPIDHDQAVGFLRQNKYPLLSMDLTALPKGLVDSPQFQQALEEDRRSFATQRDEYLKVRDEWLHRGISGLFIKTACIPPSFPYASDNLDILVREELGDEARAALRKLGYSELPHIEEPKKFLFRKFRNGTSTCAIHLHHWTGWNINFFEEELLWDRARVAPDDHAVPAPSPEDALLINLAHALYENKRFSAYDLDKMRVNWNHHSLDWDYLPEVPIRRGWHDGFLLGMLVAVHLEEALTGKTAVPEMHLRRWEFELRGYARTYRYYRDLLSRPLVVPFKVSFAFSKLLYYRKIWRDSHDSTRTKMGTTARTLIWGLKLKAGIRPAPGMLVAISGMDGAGKTHQAESVTRLLQATEIRTSYYWNRIGWSPLTRLARRMVSFFRRAPDRHSIRSLEAIRLDRRSGLVQALWAWALVLDLVVRYNWRMRLPLWLGKLGFGRVVVCDRYVLDATAEILTRIPQPGPPVRAALAFLRLLSPRPNVAWVLDVDEEVAQARHAPFVSVDELRQYRKWYLELAQQFGVQVLNGRQSPSDVGDAISAAVFAQFTACYPTALNGILLANPSQLNPARTAHK